LLSQRLFAIGKFAGSLCDKIYTGGPNRFSKRQMNALCSAGAAALVGALKELYDHKFGGNVEFELRTLDLRNDLHSNISAGVYIVNLRARALDSSQASNSKFKPLASSVLKILPA